ncbi:sensor histidine kinase [Chelativorans sp. YIM 93263]|uniref:sensor histidine kinase n=1 Tax=Chelativorans sp. YIM 93263 TaxID=2906648 RepID=UPI0023796CB0|nr:histidine kinase dimerization/phosphoacceptor domain -containing protein [Chelativorans sp. YIM 93263]
MSEQTESSDQDAETDDLDDELKYRLRQQALMGQFALFALKTHDVQALLQEATRVCARGLRSKLCKIMEYLPEEDEFLVRAGVGWRPGVVGQSRARADTKSPTGYAYKVGKAFISNHLEHERRFRTPRLLAEYGVKRAINAPIHRGGTRFGVLEVDSPLDGKFTNADLVFVRGFADLLGVALERQRSEEMLKEKEAQLQRALKHQETLSEEISHRVKNSLSIVAGLLRAQSRLSSDPHLQQALFEAQTRVETIAKVNDRLWRANEVHAVNLAEFVGELCEHVGAASSSHDLTYTIAPVTIPAEEAISLGLLTNELITNALKHAYPGSSGPISITLERAGPHDLCLTVRDYGVGRPHGESAESTKGTGSRVILNLCRHLGGHYEWQNADPGTRFTLTFTPSDLSDRVAPPPVETNPAEIAGSPHDHHE